MRLGTLSGDNTGRPSTSTTWQPIPSWGLERASAEASSNAAPFVIKVVEVTTPLRCASTMARFTPGVSPKSSALTISLRKATV